MGVAVSIKLIYINRWWAGFGPQTKMLISVLEVRVTEIKGAKTQLWRSSGFRGNLQINKTQLLYKEMRQISRFSGYFYYVQCSHIVSEACVFPYLDALFPTPSSCQLQRLPTNTQSACRAQRWGRETFPLSSPSGPCCSWRWLQGPPTASCLPSCLHPSAFHVGTGVTLLHCQSDCANPLLKPFPGSFALVVVVGIKRMWACAHTQAHMYTCMDYLAFISKCKYN